MPRDDTMWNRLESARDSELQKLGEIMKLRDPKEMARDALIEELSKKIRWMEGHVASYPFYGPHGFPYKQIVIDVADKLAPGWTPLAWTGYKLGDEHTEIEVEEKAWHFYEKILERKLRKTPPEAKEDLRRNMADELRRMGYQEALITQVGTGLLGTGVGALVGPGLAYQVALNTASGLAWVKLWWVGKAALAAVLGWSSAMAILIYGPALVWWLGNTSYRFTIPAVLYLIQIRKLREIERKLD